MDQSIRLGLLDKIGSEGVIDMACREGINQYCPRIELVDEAMVEYVHSKGMTLRPSHVRTIELMNKAIALKVDGMTINFPDKLAQALDNDL